MRLLRLPLWHRPPISAIWQLSMGVESRWARNATIWWILPQSCRMMEYDLLHNRTQIRDGLSIESLPECAQWATTPLMSGDDTCCTVLRVEYLGVITSGGRCSLTRATDRNHYERNPHHYLVLHDQGRCRCLQRRHLLRKIQRNTKKTGGKLWSNGLLYEPEYSGASSQPVIRISEGRRSR